jgi:hypothetical protein
VISTKDSDGPGGPSYDHESCYYLEPGDRVVFTIMDGAPHSRGRTMIDQPGPFIAIRSFNIEGPVYESWPPKGHRTLFGDIDPAQPTREKAADRTPLPCPV